MIHTILKILLKICDFLSRAVTYCYVANLASRVGQILYRVPILASQVADLASHVLNLASQAEFYKYCSIALYLSTSWSSENLAFAALVEGNAIAGMLVLFRQSLLYSW